jgi:hypothetical protein
MNGAVITVKALSGVISPNNWDLGVWQGLEPAMLEWPGINAWGLISGVSQTTRARGKAEQEQMDREWEDWNDRLEEEGKQLAAQQAQEDERMLERWEQEDMLYASIEDISEPTPEHRVQGVACDGEHPVGPDQGVPSVGTDSVPLPLININVKRRV